MPLSFFFYCYSSHFKCYHLTILSVLGDVKHPSNHSLVSKFLPEQPNRTVGLLTFRGTPMQDVLGPKEPLQSLLSELAAAPGLPLSHCSPLSLSVRMGCYTALAGKYSFWAPKHFNPSHMAQVGKLPSNEEDR